LRAGLADAAGTPLPNDAVKIALHEPSRRVLVRPTQLLSAAVGWTRIAGRVADPRAIRLRIGGSPSTLDLRLDGLGLPSGPDPAPPGFRAGATAEPLSVANPGSIASLTPYLATPATVAEGKDLHYLLALTNHTRTPVALTDCPGYDEQLTVAKGTAGFRGELPCGSHPRAIAPGRSRYFDLTLPGNDQPAGPGELRVVLHELVGGAQPVPQDAALLEVRTAVQVSG